MCLAIPAKIQSIKNHTAEVDFGDDIRREIDISMVNVNIGDYVLVHAGFAIEVLSEEAAKETLELWEQILTS